MKPELIQIIKTVNEYCSVIENAVQYEKDEFVSAILRLLPGIYSQFYDYNDEKDDLDDVDMLRTYVDEDQYESIRSSIATVIAEDDTFLETFEEDMKYSDTPIAATISELLADIYQPLCNFVSNVRESEGDLASAAYSECRILFRDYWSQLLCNVMRPLNNIKFR